MIRNEWQGWGRGDLVNFTISWVHFPSLQIILPTAIILLSFEALPFTCHLNPFAEESWELISRIVSEQGLIIILTKVVRGITLKTEKILCIWISLSLWWSIIIIINGYFIFCGLSLSKAFSTLIFHVFVFVSKLFLIYVSLVLGLLVGHLEFIFISKAASSTPLLLIYITWPYHSNLNFYSLIPTISLSLFILSLLVILFVFIRNLYWKLTVYSTCEIWGFHILYPDSSGCLLIIFITLPWTTMAILDHVHIFLFISHRWNKLMVHASVPSVEISFKYKALYHFKWSLPPENKYF